MSLRRSIIVVILVISVAILLLLVRLPQVLERVAIFKLESIGATDIHVELVYAGLNKTKLAKLNFVLEQQAHRYSIASRGINVSYELTDLLAGTLETVNVPEVSILVEVLAGGKVAEQQNIPLPADWLENIPFKKFNLENLQLELLSKNKFTYHMNANGQLEIESATAQARFDIEVNEYGTQRLELNLIPTGLSRLVISDMQSAIEPDQYIELSLGALTSVDAQLQADLGIKIDVQKLQQQLHRWGMPILPIISSGKLTMQGPLVVQENKKPSWQSKGSLALQVPKVDGFGKQLSLNIPLELGLDYEQIQLHIEKGSRISINKIKFADTQIATVLAKPLTPISCGYQFEHENWSCEPFAMEFDVPSVQKKQYSITTSNSKVEFTSVKGSLSSWTSNLNVDIPAWKIQWGEGALAQQINLDKVYGDITASNHKIKASLAWVAAGGGATMRINATHDLTTQVGQAQYQLEKVDMQQHSNVFANTVSNWPAKLRFNTGTIGLEGKISWPNLDVLPTQQGTLTLQNVGGVHGELVFTGLNSVLDIQADSQLYIKSRQNSSLAKLDIGTSVTDISLQVEMLLPQGGKPKVTVSDLVMNALGGKVTAKYIEIDLARKQNPFILQVRGFDMEELLKLEEKQGLLGTGIIDGELPLLMTADGITMQSGFLGARKPGGKLRYSASEDIGSMAKTNASVELLITAMKNFSYTVLEAVADYTPDGLLKLKVRIEGNNPELEGGRPVHLNVNVENNILELLRSLRLASDISDNIAEQVKNRQLNK